VSARRAAQKPARAASVRAAYGRLPLAFYASRPGLAGRYPFQARGDGASLLLSARETVFLAGGSALRMRLQGADGHARLQPARRLPGIVNEFLGNDRANWRRNLPTFARLQAAEVYPGVDLVFHGRRGALEYDFVLAPGADPGLIGLRFSGQKGMRLDGRGNLLVRVGAGELRQLRPRAFQDGKTVPARFRLLGESRVAFALGRYDRSRPLLIDPSIFYSTYLGGGGNDVGYGVAVDAGGNAYLTGQTASTNFPTASPLQGTNGGGFDAFVTKLNAAGSALVYSSYVGGTGTEVGNGIAVDGTGSVYLAGETSSVNFPTASPFQAANGGGSDAFVTKLNSAGSALAYSSYLGGTLTDRAFGIAVDGTGSAYMIGETNSTNFPTASPYQAASGGNFDVFAAKVNVAGSAKLYSTYLGGSSSDEGYGIAVDGSGNAYLTGETSSTNFPTASALQAASGGITDGFVTKLNTAGSALTYSSYLGGSGVDRGRAISLDAGGNAYLTGETTSTNFPTQSAFQASIGGATDAFVAKLNAAGSAMVYSSYLGGGLADIGRGIAVDGGGNASLTGETSSTNFPTASPFQATNGGAADAFATKVNANGSALAYSSYLGGSGTDRGRGIAVDAGGSAYLTGDTNSTNFPTANAFQATNGGVIDAFVTKIASATAVALRSFSAVRSGGSVLVRWRTGSEVGLAGFELYRNGLRFVLRPAAGSAAGRAYAVRDRHPGARPRYTLVLVRLDGTRSRYGAVNAR
jgi:hypothetical protein